MVLAVSGHRGFGGLLRQRSFRLLWSGETSSQLGNAMAGVAMPLLAVDVLHASNFAVASLTAAAIVPWLVIGLFAGAWVDRLPVRPVMVICDLVSLALYGSLPVAYWLGVLTFAQMLTVALLVGGCSVVFLTAYYVYLPALVSAADLIEGNAKLQAGGAATRIGGPALGGLVSQAIGPAATLLFNAASFGLSAACFSGIRSGTSGRDRGTRTATIRQDISQGIRFVATDRYLRRLALFAAVYNLGLSGYLALIVVFLVRSVGLSSGAVGVILAIGGTGGLLGALIAGPLTRRYGTSRGLVLNVACTTPFTLLIPLTAPGPKLAFCVAGVAMLEGGLIIASIIIGSFEQAYCPPEILGRVITSTQMLTYGTAAFGALLAGGLASWLGPRNAMWITLSTGLLAAALLLTPMFIRHRDLPQRPPAAAP
jgi:MFS family permease